MDTKRASLPSDKHGRTAEICLNGHVMIDWVEQYPPFHRNFCAKCGQPAITACPHCKAPIAGNYHDTPWGSHQRWPSFRPNHCGNCGSPFPWLEVATTSAKELADTLQHLSDKDKVALKALIPDLVVDTPKTTAAAIKFRQLAAKAGPATLDVFKTVLVAIITSEANTIIFGL